MKKMLDLLTDVYDKSPVSNIGKLFQIGARELQRLQTTLERIGHWRDIDQAQGKTLDRIGENVLQPRGSAADEVFRILIKSKIARNLSRGTVDTIIAVLSTVLDCRPSEIRIKELFHDPLQPQPAAISLIQLPVDRLNRVGMNPEQFAQIIQKTVSAGVSVGHIELTGTFSYGAVGEESDSEAGFSDLEQTVGGTLGAVYSSSTTGKLPI
ncbi:hypothetical protein DNH61_07810 [Paenibacillus sambharensis]|uniref:DUF2612 domain-containing protein n=2 Tax=Paenibacillus sambharensis TaxID=1803190 RepID=A0A2W1LXQ9_9BACL|nr:hypothetical protein DNH61_07810 [Paenibacillus sambharensis]